MLPAVSSILSIGGVLLFALQSAADPQNNQKPLVEHDDAYPNRDAEITIYRETEHCIAEKGQPVSNVDIPMDTCVSANFTLNGRVWLGFHGLCAGWRKSPSAVIYEGTDCSGNQKRLPWRSSGMGPGHCLTNYLWDPSIRDEMASLKEWSIMFHCTDDESITNETPKMDIAEPPPPPPPTEKPGQSRLAIASVSDSACDIGAKGFNRQLPLADICINVAASRRLKIFSPALCPDGTEARFAKWHQSGCRGKPVSVQEVDESLIADDSPESCIKMGGRRDSSYAFVCGGDIEFGAYAVGIYAGENEDGEEIHRITVHQQTGGMSKSVAMGSYPNVAWSFGVSLGLLGFQLLL